MKWTINLIILVLLTMTARGQNLKSVIYKDGDQELKGLVTSNAGERLPAVLILPAWKGIDNEAKQAALSLERAGYIAFIADIYGVGNVPVDNAGASKIAQQYKADYNAYQRRIALALDELKKYQDGPYTKVAIIGYCFGGTGALEAARAALPVEGIVSIHGGLGKAADRANGPIKTKMLIQHPAEDKSVSAEDYNGLVKEMNEGHADWQIITYAHSGHTFTNSESQDYNKTMAARAWNHLLLFLEEILK